MSLSRFQGGCHAVLAVACVSLLAACSGQDDDPRDPTPDSGPGADAGMPDSGAPDGGGEPDAGPAVDGGPDAGPPGPACAPTVVPGGDPLAGSWDTRFFLPGVGGTAPTDVTAIAVAPGGEVYVGGHFSHGGPVRARNVALYTDADGWSPVGDGLEHTVTALAIHPSGAPVYAATEDPETGGARLYRWDGGVWGELARADGWVEELAVDASGALYVAGSFSTIGGAAAPRFARLAPTAGAAWANVGGAPDEEVRAILLGETETCIGGRFERIGEVAARNVACWDGTAWSPRSLPIEYYAVQSLGRDASGALVAGGHFQLTATAEVGSIARWSGVEWELIGGGLMGDVGPGYVEGIALVGDQLYVAGYFRRAGTVAADSIARWDGTTWHDVGGLFREVGFFLTERNVTQLVAAPGERVYAGGIFTRAAATSASHVAYHDASGWHTLGEPGQTAAGVNGFVDGLAARGSCGVYIGGEFEYVGEIAARNVARIDSAGAHPLGAGVTGIVRALAVDEDGVVYAGGDLPGGVTTWDGTSWSATVGIEGVVYALHVAADGTVWAGGSFMVAGATGANVASWDGAAWTVPGGGLDGEVHAFTELADGTIVAGGSFEHNVAVWDGAAWSPRGSLTGGVRSLVVHEGELIAGGTLESLGDAPGRGVVRWDEASAAWRTVGNGLDRPWDWAPTYVNGLASAGGVLFATGDVALAAGEDDVRLAYYDGTAWHGMGEPLTDIAEAIIAANDGLWIGGTFTSAGGTPAVGIAHWAF